MSDYVYPGFRPFADRAAADHEIPEAERHRVSSGPFVRDIESGLSQLPGQADRERRFLNPEGSTRDAINRIKATREVLAAQLDAIDDAIKEVLGAIDPPRTLLLKDEKQPKRSRRAKAKPESEPAAEEPQEPEDEREEDESAD